LSWSFTSDKPIYIQIVETVEKGIISQRYQPGSQLPSVRDFAILAGVNPNTMQKALAELEQRELVISRRTSGRFVTEDTHMTNKLKENFANKNIEVFLNNMQNLNISPSEAIMLIKKRIPDEEINNDTNIRV
jgi:DNA-binding transcriptional regulator YhcF (GntR family)